MSVDPARPIRREPVRAASAWLGSDLQQDSSWRVLLEAGHIAELQAAVAAARARGLPMLQTTKADLPLPGLRGLLEGVSQAVRAGRGFALLQGLPVGQASDEDVTWMYWALCQHLGTPVSQNEQGELMHSVHDRGVSRGALRRDFNNTAALSFHVDLSDLVLLCCLRRAKSGGSSLLCSSSAVFNTLLAEQPQHLPALWAGYDWDRREEHGPGEPEIGPRIPVFSEAEGRLSCVYNRGFIGAVATRTGQALPPAQAAALDAFDAVAEREGLALRMDLQPGDVQIVNNYTVLHNRTAFEDYPDFERKRRLLRVWLELLQIRPFADEALIRYGNVRYGRIGLQSAQLQGAPQPMPPLR